MVTNMCLARRLIKHIAAVWLALAGIVPACADDLGDFNRTVEAAMSHHRAASGYLRTGNVDLAVLELEGLREVWGKVTSLPRPAAFRDQERYTGTMLDISTRLVGIVLVLDLGAVDVARQSLHTIRTSLSALRRANGVTVLADCVLDANTAMDALFALDGQPMTAELTGKADDYRTTLQRCDGMAASGIRNHAEFRRLIDGALASLAQFPKAIETRDNDLMHRLLIELRSFDHLLAFRYG
jgi:hypothetical protein